MVVLHYPAPGPGASGIARYARELSAGLQRQGEPVLEWPLRNLELRLGRRRFGGLLSQRVQLAWRPGKRHGPLHSAHVYSAHPRADIATVQDCFPEMYREELGRTPLEERLWQRRLGQLVARGTRFVFATAAVRDTFLGLHPEVDIEKTHVTPYGIDAKFRPPSSEAALHPAYDSAAFNVLTVADLNPRKRFDWLLAAAGACEPGLRLVHAGSGIVHRPAWQIQLDREKPLAAGLGDDLKRLGGVSDEELVRLYQGADLLVLPSVDEGFGFPPLEALACGTPVLVLDRPVFREVLGDKAQYFQGPEDLPQAIEAARRAGRPVLSDRRRRQAWVEGRFSWSNTARQTQAVYRIAESEANSR